MKPTTQRKLLSLAALLLCLITTACGGRALIDDGTGDLDAPAFAMLYLDTPLNQLHKLEGSAHGSRNHDMGSIYFECDSPPKLKDAKAYKPGGDLIQLSDHFYSYFYQKAFPLFHTSDVECICMYEDGRIIRLLMHNRKSKAYFFSRTLGDFMVLSTEVLPDLMDMKAPEQYYIRGANRMHDEDSSKAINDFTKAIELMPDCANAYYCRGVENFRKSWPLTEADFKKTEELAPNSSLLHRSLMAHYRIEGEADLVRKEARILARLNPVSAEYIMAECETICSEIANKSKAGQKP